MKRYTLIIDPSASSPDDRLVVFEANTIKAAKAKLNELSLVFGRGFVYCATIGKKEIGRRNNRYWTVQRTDNGKDWYRGSKRDMNGQGAYNPENWLRVTGWPSIDYFRATT